MALTIVLEGQANLGVTTGIPATITIQLGTPGPAGTIVVGSTTTSAPGTDASVVNVGTVSNAILDFTIPRGAQGVQGEQGIQGERGLKGDKGDTGNAGAAASVSAGTTTTGSPGSSASVTNVGSTSAAVFNFTIPRGDVGATGATGAKGDKGDTGAGVVTGGTAGQVLAKIDGTNFNTQWIDVNVSGYLPLEGGTMDAGALQIFPATDGKDSEIGAWGFGVENTNGDYSTVEPTQIISRLYSTYNHSDPAEPLPTYQQNALFNANGISSNWNDSLNGYHFGLNSDSVYGGFTDNYWSFGNYGINFADGTNQSTAGLPISGGTMNDDVSINIPRNTYNSNINYGSYQISYTEDDGIGNTLNWSVGYLGLSETVSNGDSFNYTQQGMSITLSNGNSYSFNESGLTFVDGSNQQTAFPPAGGTSAQYIDGTGALQTFPSVSTAGKMVTSARNNSGATITKGTVVYISGAVGNKPIITKAQANSEASSKATFGFVEADIANNADGNVVQIGLLENLNTQGFTDGTQIFLSPTTAGGWTSTQPFSPYHYVRLGTVIRGGHPTLGSVSVSIINGFQLDEMSDVASTAPLNNNVLTFETSSGMWKDKSVSTALGYAPANQTLGNLTSSSTARTNLGLGTMAVETASNYLTTATAASVYTTKANNLSDLASSSTARTNLGLSSLATASFATNAESNKGTSASVALTPANALWTAMSPALHATTTFSVNNASTGGTGGTSTGGDLGVRIFTGTTAASYGAVRNGALTTYPTSRGTSSAIDWSKIVIISGTNLITPLNSVATNRFLFGTTNTGQVADLANRGIGMRQIGTGAIELQVHNGTTLTNVTSSFTPTNNTAFDFMIYSDGVGNATLYINDSSVATSASAPTGSGATTQNYIGVGSEISANVASQTFYSFGNIKTYIGR